MSLLVKVEGVTRSSSGSVGNTGRGTNGAQPGAQS